MLWAVHVPSLLFKYYFIVFQSISLAKKIKYLTNIVKMGIPDTIRELYLLFKHIFFDPTYFNEVPIHSMINHNG